MSASAFTACRRERGFTLVELMVSLVLGLIVVGGALSVVVTNKATYRTNEALSQVQESARSAFELLAREMRQAGATGCDNTGRVGSVLKSGTQWWLGSLGIIGYEGNETDPAVTTGTAVGTRVAGTDSIQIRGARGLGLTVDTHTPTSANFKLDATTTDIVVSDVLMVCDFDHATIFQVSNYNDNNVTLVHNTGTISPGPGNCSKGLGYPPECTTGGNVYTFGQNSQIVKLGAVDWYIGNNGRPDEGGRSLYRRRLTNGAGDVTEEVVAGVSDLQLLYRLEGTSNFVTATTVTAANWPKVNAISVTLVMDSADKNISTTTSNAGRLQRTFTNIVTLRNRVP